MKIRNIHFQQLAKKNKINKNTFFFFYKLYFISRNDHVFFLKVLFPLIIIMLAPSVHISLDSSYELIF